MKTLIYSVVCVGLGACGMDSPDTADLATSDTAQASTILNNCATGSDANAQTSVFDDQLDTYTRSATKIDTTCGCAAWQVDMNAHGTAQANIDYPSCRPWTYFDVTLAYNTAMGLSTEVDTWGTTSATECTNSEVDMAIEENVNGTWIPIWPVTANHFYVFHPTFDSAKGSCDQFVKQHIVTDPGVYRLKGRAIRGEDQYNHGYAGVVLFENTGVL